MAVKFYAAWLKNPQRIEPLVEDFHSKNEWMSKDRALFNDLAFGLIRQHGRNSWLINRFSNHKPPSNRFAIAAASIGLYHIQFHDRVPNHAAVDSSVHLAKKYAGPQLSGWCNAILRSAISLQEKQGDLHPRFSDNIPRLAIHYSHPEWMVERWSRKLDIEDLERRLAWNNRRPDVIIRINKNRISTAKAVEHLNSIPIDVVVSKLDESFIHLPRIGDVSKIDLVREGKAFVQDPAQGIASLLLDPKPGEEILDICAAPGGKTLHLAEMCQDCRITATDKSPERLLRLKQTTSNSKYNNIELVDYQNLLSSKKQFDAILIDAPCSGTGVLARRVDLRWRLEATDIDRMANIQKQLLKYAIEHLKPGGRIIYSTCTLEPEENEDLVEDFLRENNKFQLAGLPGHLHKFESGKGNYLQVFGPEWSSDGAFAARVEMRS